MDMSTDVILRCDRRRNCAAGLRASKDERPAPSLVILRGSPKGLAPQDDGRITGHRAFTIASSPSVSAAGPGCRISGDLISTMRLLRTAGISLQPGRVRILSGTTFLPHQDARIRSAAASRTTSGEMIRSLA